MIGYRLLLKKYIDYITDIEGVDFIETSDRRYQSDVIFEVEEWEELEYIVKEIEQDKKDLRTYNKLLEKEN